MKIQKFQKGKKIINSLDALGDLVKNGDLKLKRPKTTVTSTKKVDPVREKVNYTPPTQRTSEEIRIHNAWNKYKNQGVYATMPESEGYKLFLEDWNFRHDPKRQLVKNAMSQLKHKDELSGVETPEWMQKVIRKTIMNFPNSVRTDVPGTFKGNITPKMLPYRVQIYQMPSFGLPSLLDTSDDVFRTIIAPKGTALYKSNPDVLKIPDYFSGRSYRGIGNLDKSFINATDSFNAGAPDTAMQFLKAGLNDAAGIIGVPGFKPTSFPYKPKPKTKSLKTK